MNRISYWLTSANSRAGAFLRGLVALLVIYLLVIFALSIYWNHEPPSFSIDEAIANKVPVGQQAVVTGTATTATFIKLAENLLDKRGGYMSNDVAPPTVLMDNVPEWEFGVLVQLREMGRMLRTEFSRSQSQSSEDPDLAQAEGQFYFDNSSWLFPNTEHEYRQGIELVDSYLTRLADPQISDAQFFARADNLAAWLATVEKHMGDLSQRLSASVGKDQLNLDLAGDAAATRSTSAPQQTRLKTPFLQIDNVFYEARGQCYALIHLLKAVERDFKPILERKNALVSLQQIIRELETTQDSIWSPMVLSGRGFGLVANYSLVMGGSISRAHAAVIDLRRLLEDG